MIVPFAAGGPVDTVGRIMAARLSEILGQQVVVENYGGAGGMTGSSRAAKSAPDGYTVLLGGLSVLAQVPTLYKKPLYDPIADFTPVTLFADSARVLITRKDLPADTFKTFIAYAKANEAKMQYGSAGSGSGSHICAVLLNSTMGTNVTHVPYRGSAMAMRDLMGGRLDFICEQISTAVPQIQAGTVKAVVTFGASRISVLPDLPSTQELGFNDLDCGTWNAFVFPKGTPDAIVRRLAQATSEAVDSASVRERFASVGVTVVPAAQRSPEYLAGFVKREIDKWSGPIRSSGASAD
jgi:tripartite-type tricarboxylate transporter receptor subunit TctC